MNILNDKTTKSMLIRGGEVYKSHIDRKELIFEEQWEFRKQHGGKICAPFLHSFANIGTDKHCVYKHMPMHFLGNVICGADGQCLADFYVLQIWSVFNK